VKNRSALTISAVVFLLTMLVATEKASAVPAFARQTGMPCAACHFQHYPALNDFGVMFKTNGYTMIGAQGKVEGKDLSIPDTLNASLVTKIRYQKTNGDSKTDTDKGELQFPDEGALLIGGRAGEHAGFLLEIQLPEGDESAFASFRMPIVYDLRGTALSVVPFTTDAGGAAYGFELLNTGAMRMQRILEDRNTTSAQQFIGTATEAQGIALVAANGMGFVNATMWAPVHGNSDAGLKMSHYLRLAATPKVGAWSTGIGGQYWGGKTKIGDTDLDPLDVYNTKAWAVDAQAQGGVGAFPLGLYLSYANASGDAGSTETILFNCRDTTGDGVCDTNNPNDKTAWSLLAELGVLPEKATVALGYRGGDNGRAANSSSQAAVIGATYSFAQNIVFQLNHTLYSGDAYDPKPAAGGDQLTTLMIFAAF
jgi:hypothetical protein